MVVKSAGTFRSKPSIILSTKPMFFDGVRIRKIQDGVITLEERDKIAALIMQTDDREFSTKRTMAQYLGVNCRPSNVCAGTTGGARERVTDEG